MTELAPGTDDAPSVDGRLRLGDPGDAPRGQPRTGRLEPGRDRSASPDGHERSDDHEPEDRSEAERVLSRALGAEVRLESDPAALSARTSDPERVAHALAELSRSGVALTDFSLGQPSLDEVFLALTGRPAEADDTEEEDAA